MDMNDSEVKDVRATRILGDVLILVVVGTPILILFLTGAAYERGFYCDDESIRHPYKDSTVPSYWLYIFGVGCNIIVMFITEFRRYKHNNNHSKIRILGITLDSWWWEFYMVFMVFCFGALCSQLITDSFKYSIGRLRPHFYTVCMPKIEGKYTCDNYPNKYKYIQNYECSNPELKHDHRKLKEMRLSFPSGHSSFSMYTMLYFAIYVQARVRSMHKQLKHTIQYLAVLAALLVAMSRISDYKHHWSDVLSGLSIGALTAIVVSRFVSNLFMKESYKKLEGITELNPMNNGNSTTLSA